MAGTATNYDSTKIVVDTVAQIWANLAVPAAAGRLALHTDGTPLLASNPNAVHLGHTREGVKLTVATNLTKHYVDELAEPIKATVEATEMMFEGEFLQVLDDDILKTLTAPFGTYSSGSGYKEFSIGRKTLTYSSIALIFPTPEDVTKYAVAHIYNGMNEAGLDYTVSRKTMAGTPFKFVAYALSGRAASDTVGKYWFQV
jgi:hypothetical protein